MLKSLHINNLWGKYAINWENIDPQVNILVGINGSGKSTVLSLIKEHLEKKNGITKKTNAEVHIDFTNDFVMQNDIPKVYYVNTFDAKSKISKSNLDIQLEHLTFKKETANAITFLDYRLNMFEQSALKIEEYKNRIDVFFNLINDFFVKTNKKIFFDKNNRSIKFSINEKEIIELSDLSAGEKQLLILLFTVFLQDEQPCLFLLDEPEISLHIEWQDILIDTLITLNPNAQFIIVTHSPSVFGEGWCDKLTWMEDIYNDAKLENKKISKK